MKTTKEIITIIKKVKEKVREANKDRYPEQQRINPYQTIMLLEKELFGEKQKNKEYTTANKYHTIKCSECDKKLGIIIYTRWIDYEDIMCFGCSKKFTLGNRHNRENKLVKLKNDI